MRSPRVLALVDDGLVWDDPADSDAPVGTWVPVCELVRLIPDRGVAALLPGGSQVAVFLLSTGELYGIDNRDPFSSANVLSRGIVGDRGGAPKVASPVYKQSFDLRTGRCLDDETVTVATYRIRVRDGTVEVLA
ncbi:MAG: nitrite reductase small subunit NirD [Acidimicrobiales bacterium]